MYIVLVYITRTLPPVLRGANFYSSRHQAALFFLLPLPRNTISCPIIWQSWMKRLVLRVHT